MVDPSFASAQRTRRARRSVRELFTRWLRHRARRGVEDNQLAVEPLEPRQMMTINSPPTEFWPTEAAAISLQAADLNGDAYEDIVALDASGRLIAGLNDSSTWWRPVEAQDFGFVDAYAMTVGNFDSDSLTDAVVAHEGGVTTLHGQGNGLFTLGATLTWTEAGVSYQAGTSAADMIAGLFDGDYRADVAVVVPGANSVLVLKGDGEGAFTATSTLTINDGLVTALAAGQFSGDAATDLAVGTTTGQVIVFPGSTTGIASQSGVMIASNSSSVVDLAASDLDGDGDTDLVVARTGSVEVLVHEFTPALGSELVNGSFDAGLTGWTTTGPVTANGGEAEFREGSSLLTSLSQTFTLPAGATALSFDITGWNLEDRSGEIPDAFEVSLLDDANNSVVATFRDGVTSFFNVAGDGTVRLADGVSFDGRTVTLDLSSVSAGTEVTLYFDLVGLPPEAISTARIDNVRLLPDNGPTSTFQQITLSGSPVAPKGVAVGDTNGDGVNEILVVGGSEFIAYTGELANGFTPTSVPIASEGTATGPLTVGQFTGSGELSVAVALTTGIASPIAIDLVAPTATLVAPVNGADAGTVSEIVVSFSESVVARDSQGTATTLGLSSFSLTSAGADETFGTADDVVISFSGISYDPTNHNATLFASAPLAAGLYELAVATPGLVMITDLFGNNLASGLGTTFTFRIGEDPDTGGGDGHPLACGEDVATLVTDVTTDNDAIVVSGTASPYAEVAVAIAGLGVVGRAFADAAGDWIFQYNSVLPPGEYQVTASAQVAGPLGIATEFNVFVFEDFSHNSSDVGGRVAVGGNATLSGHGVGTAISNSAGTRDDLIVGGNLNFSNGNVYSGNVVVGGTATLATDATISGGSLHSGMPIDFAAAQAALTAKSAAWAQLTANGLTEDRYGGTFLTGTDTELNIFDLSATQLASTWGVTVEVPSGSAVIVNIHGTTAQMQNFAFTLTGANRQRLIWNFHEAETLSIQGINVPGVVMAPHAAVTFNNGSLDGQIIARSLSGSGEPHWFPFTHSCPVYSSEPFAFVVEETTPATPGQIQITSVVQESADDGTIILNGTARPSELVTIRLAGVAIGTTQANASGAWTFDYTATELIAGSYDFTALGEESAAVGAAENFGIFVLADGTFRYSQIDGPVAIGGNATLEGLGVNTTNVDGDGLVVGGNLSYQGGQVVHGQAAVGGTVNLTNGATIVEGVRQDAPIDFDAAALALVEQSETWNAHATTGNWQNQWGALTLTGTDSELNVFRLSVADLVGVWGITINVPGGAAAVINVAGTSVTLQNANITLSGIDKTQLVWNFFEATSLTVQGMTMRGTIFAPHAYVQFPNGELQGQLIAQSVNGQAGIKHAPLAMMNAAQESAVFTVVVADAASVPRFFVVDGVAGTTYSYDADGTAIAEFSVDTGTASLRGVAADPTGQQLWVVDNAGIVRALTADGTLLGSWTASGLTDSTGIAVSGTDIWIVDATSDRVYRFNGGASLISGTHAASESFALHADNFQASGLEVRGNTIWITDDGSSVAGLFVYDVAGVFQGAWELDIANAAPSGVTVNPNGGGDLWVVDRDDALVYHYANATDRLTGQQAATGSFVLATNNGQPEGIADPPGPIEFGTTYGDELGSTSEVDVWTFTAEVGQRLYIELGTANFWSLKFSVIDPDGETVFSDWSEGSAFIVQEAGTYRLEVTTFYEIGAYTFTVIQAPPPSAPITFAIGQQVNGQLTVPYQTDVYQLTALAGQELILQLLPGDLADVSYRLLSPDGSQIFLSLGDDVDLFTASVAGVYTFEVTSSSASTGSYAFQVIEPPVVGPISLTLDTPWQAVVDLPGQRNLYEFTVAAGQRFFVNFQGGNFFRLQSKLTGPGGEVVFEGRLDDLANSPARLVVAPIAGTYTLELASSDGNVSATELTVLDVAIGVAQPMVLNTSVAGTLDKPGTLHRYELTASAGNRLELLWTQRPVDGRVRLIDANGLEIHADESDGFFVPASGNYFVEVDSSSFRTGAYSFQLRSRPVSDQGLVTLGVEQSGSLTSSGEVDRFTLDVAAGQRIYIDTISAASDFSFYWSVMDSQGQLVASNYFYYSGGVNISETGSYTLDVFSTQNRTGNYRFAVLDAPAVGPSPLTLGTPVSATLSGPGALHLYEFEGTAGQRLGYVVNGDHYSFEATVTGPDGQIVEATNGELTLTATGTYTVAVSSSQGSSGQFTLLVDEVQVNGPIAIAFGEEVQGDIRIPGWVDEYSISVSGAGTLVFDLIETGDGLNTEFSSLVLTGPDGQQWYSYLDDGLFEDLPQAGTYTLTVSGIWGETGTYAFILTQELDEEPPIDIELNQLVTGTWDQPFQARSYTFAVTEGQRVFFDAIVGQGTAGWELIGPDDQSIFAASFDDRDVLVLEAGQYRLILNDNGDTANYEFQLWDVPEIVTQSIISDQAISSAIAIPGQEFLYQFVAGAGQTLFLDITDPGTNQDWIRFIVRDVAGDIVLNAGPTGTALNRFEEFAPRVLAGGIYTIEVDQASSSDIDDTNTFAFTVYLHNAPMPVEGGLRVPTSGILSRPGETDLFTFDLSPGRFAYLDLISDNSSYPVNFDFELTEIGTTPEGGRRYQVAVSGDHGDWSTTGSYVFRVWDVPMDSPIDIETNTVITGTTEVQSQIQTYHFVIAETDDLYFDVSQPDSHRYTLRNSAGVILFDSVSSDVQIPDLAAGSYTLEVERFSGLTLDDYAFALWQIPPDVPQAAAIGQPVIGESTVGGQRQTYTFTWTAGHELYLDLLNIDSSGNPVTSLPPSLEVQPDQSIIPPPNHRFTLVAPDGTELLTTVTADRSIVPTLTGTYQLVVERLPGVGSAAHGFQLLDLEVGDPGLPDSQGTEYWLGFPPQFALTLFGARGPQDIRLFITSETAASGTVTVPGLHFGARFSIQAGEVAEIDLPSELIEIPLGGFTAGVDRGYGVRVTSDAEITVYGNSRQPASSDAFLALPVDALGTEYLVASYRNQRPYTGGQFVVVGTEANTTVTIVRGASDGRAGEVETVTLGVGQVHGVFGGDLTGTLVSADKAVAVFSGHNITNIPSTQYAAGDYLVEQLPPVSQWGNHYLTLPLATRSGDTFRVISGSDGNEIFINGTAVATLDRGEFHELILTEPAEITAAGRILVVQYSNSSSYDGAVGDPFMMLLPSSDQLRDNYVVQAIDAVNYTRHFLNVVIPEAAAGTLMLDGQSIPLGNFIAVANGWLGVQLEVSAGSHHLEAGAGFSLTTYGFGPYDSYGYPGGTAARPVEADVTFSLSPESKQRSVGRQHTLVASLRDEFGQPRAGVDVTFTVTGMHPQTAIITTNAAGLAIFQYTGNLEGTDTVTATAEGLSDVSTVEWGLLAAVITLDGPAPGVPLVPGQTILLTGTAESVNPGGRIVHVLINGQPVDSIDATGRFFHRVSLVDGLNAFTAIAIDNFGAEGDTDRVLFASAAPTDPVANWDDITATAQLVYSGTTFNRATNQLLVSASLLNTGSDPLDAPIVAAFGTFAPGTVALDSPETTLSDGRDAIVFDTELPTNGLAPASESQPISLAFQVSDYERFSFDVTLLAPSNTPPHFTSIPPTSVVAGRVYSYTVLANDAEQQSLEFAADIAPPGLVIDSTTGVISWTPQVGDVGLHQVRVVARDGRGGLAVQEFWIEVLDGTLNRPPVFLSAPPTNVATGGDYSYAPELFDVDGDPLTLSLEDAPVGMSLDTATGTITWSNAIEGNYRVLLRLTDNRGGVAWQEFVLVVGNTPTAGSPVVTSTPPSSAVVGQLFIYQPVALDTGEGTLEFTLVEFPAGMTINATTGEIRWTPTLVQSGLQTVTMEVDDGLGGVSTQTFEIFVRDVALNRAPQFTSNPLLFATAGQSYVYASSARDADEDPLSFELVDGPAGMEIDTTTGRVTWTVPAAAIGPQRVVLRVTDTFGAKAEQAFYLEVRPQNEPPVFVTTPPINVVAGTVFRYDADAIDSADAITYRVLTGPTGTRIDPQTGLVTWSAPPDLTGTVRFILEAKDERGATTQQVFDVTILADTQAPTAVIAGPLRLPIGSGDFFRVIGTDNVAVASATLMIDGQLVALDQAWTTTFTPTHTGSIELVATVTDTSGNTTTVSRRLDVFDPADDQFPVVSLNVPASGIVVTYLTDLIGTVSDDNLSSYKLEYALLGSNQWTVFAEGYANVIDATLGTFDPTMLANDAYRIRLTATDTNLNTAWTEATISIEGNAKLGEFALEFTDLQIPLAGIPITITRRYSTLEAGRQGDFGYGWSLAWADARIRETLPVGPNEQQLGSLFGSVASFERGTRVYLTTPSGQRIGFTFDPVLSQNQGLLGAVWMPRFVADAGVFETLEVDAVPLRQLQDGSFALYFGGFNYNPEDYTLVTKDGTRWRYNQFSGLESVTDRNGNGLTYTRDGILHTSGQSIQFIRDDQGRITEIVDPDGNSLYYEYDTTGDLVQITDQEDNITRLWYHDDRAHYLETVTRPGCGCPSTAFIRTEFDDEGRVTARYDAEGNVVGQNYDLAAQVETVTDQLGNQTTLEYDLRGNITAIVDALGNRTELAYDAYDNATAIVNARGNTTSYAYDNAGNVTSVTYANGGLWQYTYNTSNDVTSITDAEGRQATFLYDSLGNLVRATDADGENVQFTHDAQGRIRTISDAKGRTTSFSYGDQNSPTEIIHPDGTTVVMAYSTYGLPTLLIDELGYRTELAYDDAGRLESISDPTGNLTTFAWDGQRLIGVTDRLGRTTSYSYDDREQLTQVIDAEGGVYSYQYDAAGRMIAESNPLGQVTEYVLDILGRTTTVTLSAGLTDTGPVTSASTSYAYDSVGNLVSMTDAAGKETTYTYDVLDRLITRTDAAGGTVGYIYDSVSNVVGFTNELGRTWSFAYDALDRLTTTTNPLGGTVARTYDVNSNLTSFTDENGNATSYTYDIRDRLSVITDAAGNSVTYGYDATGNTTSVTDRRGFTTRYVYDALDRLSTITNALGDSQSFLYDAEGNVTQWSDELGRSWGYAYDDLNRLVALTDPLSGVQTYIYDPGGRLLQYTDQNGHAVSYQYNLFDQVTRVTNALGDFDEYLFDDVGNLTQYVNANGRATTFSHDNLHRLTQITDPLSYTETFAYDAASNLTSAADAAGYVTIYGYDELNRLTSVTDALGGVVGYGYDAAGNRTSFTDELGRTTGYVYDDLNRQVKVIDPRSTLGNEIATTLSYDESGYLLAITDPLGNATSYAYDALGRMTSRTDPLGRRSDYVYDAVSNLIQTTDRNDRVRVFAYDDLDRLVSERWLNEQAQPVNEALFVYDPVGNLLETSDAYSRYTYTYDAVDRLITTDNTGTPGAPSVQLAYTYDAVGNTIHTADSFGVTVASEYDARDQLISRLWGNLPYGSEARVDFAYDARGLTDSIRRASDLAGSALSAQTDFAYDALGRLTDLTHTDPLGAVLSDYEYAFDAAHQLLQESHHGYSVDYGYDLAGQLISAERSDALPHEAYEYDENGNRIGDDLNTDANNQLTTDGEFTYTYDAEGNLLTKTEIASGEVTTYQWDHRNRLVSVTVTSAGGILLSDVQYTYDVFDRRIARTVDGTKTHFVYDANHVWADFDAVGNMTARYLFGEQVDQILARWRPGEGVAFHLTDHLGSVRDIVNSAGVLMNTIDYDSFGNILTQTNPAAGDRYTYTGREWDAAIGLYHYRARWYDAGTGRFLSQDPLGFSAGDVNLYRYVFNQPTGLTDPSGQLAMGSYAKTLKKVAGSVLFGATAGAAGGAGYGGIIGMVCGTGFVDGAIQGAKAGGIFGAFLGPVAAFGGALGATAFAATGTGFSVTMTVLEAPDWNTVIVQAPCTILGEVIPAFIGLRLAKGGGGGPRPSRPNGNTPTKPTTANEPPPAARPGPGDGAPGKPADPQGSTTKEPGGNGEPNCFVAGTQVHVEANEQDSESTKNIWNESLVERVFAALTVLATSATGYQLVKNTRQKSVTRPGQSIED